MFRRLRNKFMILLMVTVTTLMFLFFTAITIFVYTNADARTTETLNRGYYDSEKPPKDFALNRFAPVFSVDVDGQGNILNMNSNFELDLEFSLSLLSLIKTTGAVTAVVEYEGVTWKYKVFDLDEGLRIVFLDVSRDVQTLSNLLYTLLWVTLPMQLLVFFVSKYFADRSIKPIEDVFNRQNQFIADASHELRTPLTTISTNASVLMADAAPEQRKWLEFIKDEVMRMERLTSGLLYLSRSPQKTERVRCSLSEIVRGIIMPLEAVFYEKNIRCETEVDSDVFIYANPEQIERLVSILVDNAIKYTESFISITLVKDHKNAVLTVTNNGIGIPREDLDKIWDRFYRTDKARNYKGGFGLGLAMAKSIVADNKGIIRATSTENEQTTFTVTLPVGRGETRI